MTLHDAYGNGAASAMHGHGAHAADGEHGHDQHAGHSVAGFRDKFWVSLLLMSISTIIVAANAQLLRREGDGRR